MGLFLRQLLSCAAWCVLGVMSWRAVETCTDDRVWVLWTVLATFGFGSFALDSLIIRVTKQRLPSPLSTPSFSLVAAWCVVARVAPRSDADVYLAALAAVAGASVLHLVLYARRVSINITAALDIPFWTVPPQLVKE